MPQSTPANFDNPAAISELRSLVVLSLILFVGTLLLYYPALNSAFVNYDDPAYVTANARVLQGLSWSNVAWAFTATIEANWHPITWISHMADVQFFGTNPRGHHLVSILLHALNALLLFLVLRRATGYLFRSAMVAALFAVHPSNVECVAWVAERKSLLSMLFFLLTLAAYDWYVSKRSPSRYAGLVLLFALGLAAKPMIVTLPILFLLWDYWPLQRIRSTGETTPPFLRLVAEKIPLLAIAAASSWITLVTQRSGGALGNTEFLPLGQRLENAIYSYLAYIGKGIWPVRLAVFYPHPEGSLAAWKVIGAALLIVAITTVAWIHRKHRRYLLMGWLWYLVAMVPMIGIVQVGRQAMADRYAYLPFVGLFIIAVWGCSELLAHLKVSGPAQASIAAAVLVAYACTAFLQINYWRNSYTLFSHAVAVTSRNGIAEVNLGTALVEMGRSDLALGHFQAAADYVPRLATAHYNLGILQQQLNRSDAARCEYELAIKYSSDENETAQSHNNLGSLSLDLNDPQAAIEHFTAALRINPGKQHSLLGRGIAEYRQRNLQAAVADLYRAAQIAPLAQADFWLGRALEDQGQIQAASDAYRLALRLAPGMVDARQRLDALQESQK